MNQESESKREDLYMSIGAMKDSKLKTRNLHASQTIRYSQDLFVYYESIKRQLKRRLIYEYWGDERLKTKNEESTRLGDYQTNVCLLLIDKERGKDKTYI